MSSFFIYLKLRYCTVRTGKNEIINSVLLWFLTKKVLCITIIDICDILILISMNILIAWWQTDLIFLSWKREEKRNEKRANKSSILFCRRRERSRKNRCSFILRQPSQRSMSRHVHHMYPSINHPCSLGRRRSRRRHSKYRGGRDTVAVESITEGVQYTADLAKDIYIIFIYI